MREFDELNTFLRAGGYDTVAPEPETAPDDMDRIRALADSWGVELPVATEGATNAE